MIPKPRAAFDSPVTVFVSGQDVVNSSVEAVCHLYRLNWHLDVNGRHRNLTPDLPGVVIVDTFDSSDRFETGPFCVRFDRRLQEADRPDSEEFSRPSSGCCQR